MCIANVFENNSGPLDSVAPGYMYHTLCSIEAFAFLNSVSYFILSLFLALSAFLNPSKCIAQWQCWALSVSASVRMPDMRHIISVLNLGTLRILWPFHQLLQLNSLIVLLLCVRVWARWGAVVQDACFCGSYVMYLVAILILKSLFCNNDLHVLLKLNSWGLISSHSHDHKTAVQSNES